MIFNFIQQLKSEKVKYFYGVDDIVYNFFLYEILEFLVDY